MATKWDITVYQGDDRTWPIRLRHADLSDPANPVYTPFDLTGYTFASHIRQDYADYDDTVDAQFVFQVVDAAAGELLMTLKSEDSANMSGRYRYDFQIVRVVDDYVTTLLYGICKVQSEVTRT